MDTELAGASDEKRAELLRASAALVESMGPIVLDHSRLDHGVLGNEDDADRLSLVFKALFPGTDREMARRQHHRDAMHIATAIRYGAHAFVTNETRLLKKSERIRARFNDFMVIGPTEACRIAERKVAACLALTARTEVDTRSTDVANEDLSPRDHSGS